jgi:predicted site-specific integrase-resolvase
MLEIANKKYLTTKDVQEMFKVSRATIINWRNKGILETTVIGSKVYFTKEDVMKLIRKEG